MFQETLYLAKYFVQHLRMLCIVLLSTAQKIIDRRKGHSMTMLSCFEIQLSTIAREMGITEKYAICHGAGQKDFDLRA